MTAEDAIERLTLRRLRLPLKQPYKLAIGPVEAFDTVLVELRLGDGRRGWGEATVLTGYTEETIDGAWSVAGALADGMPGRGAEASKTVAMAAHGRAPFTTTAFVTALEMAAGHALLDGGTERRAPLLAIVNATDRDAIADEIEARLAEGYGTLKVKVGFDLAADMDRLAYIQERVDGRAVLRVDANQGYGQADGVAFVTGIDPAGVELVEQTCVAGDWRAAEAVADAARGNNVPVMLDESIYGTADIDRAAELGCADIIKLKLMKAGGIDALVGALRRIRASGMRPVLGNGVAGDIGCWMEACVAAAEIDGAGEMNGFLKPRRRLFELPMRLEHGDLVLSASGRVTADIDALDAHTLDRREVH